MNISASPRAFQPIHLLLAGFQMSFLIVYAMISRPCMDEDSRYITSFSRLAHGARVAEASCCLGLGFSACSGLSQSTVRRYTWNSLQRISLNWLSYKFLCPCLLPRRFKPDMSVWSACHQLPQTHQISQIQVNLIRKTVDTSTKSDREEYECPTSR